MDDLIETPATNAHDYTVSEISGAVKRTIEDQFGRVRVRGEIGRVSRPSSGHIYFDLKDDRAVMAAVTWKGQAARLTQRPEEGMEVIATGRLTTFPGQSKYQMIVDQIELAGQGALMAMLDRRRRALAAEGLFDEARKQALPFLPRVIGVVTSPSGAVIRDILHRLRDRFPTHVVIWPVAVQGQDCAPQVAAAIRGFNALAPGGPVPRPDLLIVARGGGSLEDLWGFNEEIVVRAAADSTIPLISAVGHETDTTLIDFAADMRAPTPTAAAEIAVPVRADLAARLAEGGARMARASAARLDRAGQRLRDLGRALGRPGALTEGAGQRFDASAARLEPAMARRLERAREGLTARPVTPRLLVQFQQQRSSEVARWAHRLDLARLRRLSGPQSALAALRLRPAMLARLVADQAKALEDRSARLTRAYARRMGDARQATTVQAEKLTGLSERLAIALPRRLTAETDRLARLERLRQSLGHRETLARGFAIVRGPEGVVTSAAQAATLTRFEVEFADGTLPARPDMPPKRKAKPPAQSSLF